VCDGEADAVRRPGREQGQDGAGDDDSPNIAWAVMVVPLPVGRNGEGPDASHLDLRKTPILAFGCVAQRGPRLRFVTRAELDKQPSDVQRMFDAVARRYDVTNDVLSMGQDRRWRREVLAAVAAAGERVLDLAAGTGTSSEPFAAGAPWSSRATSRSAC
jgi:hypothetical protein